MKYLSALFLLALSGCMLQPQLLKQTPSGFPEATAAGLSIEQVKSAIIDGCVKRKLQIYDANSNQVVCGRAMSGAETFFSPIAKSNVTSTESEIKVRFTLYQSGDRVNIVANQWIETQKPFYQIDRQEVRSNQAMNDIQQFLFDVGAK